MSEPPFDVQNTTPSSTDVGKHQSDLKALEESTQSFLDVIQQWQGSNNGNADNRLGSAEMRKQVGEYVNAVKKSLTAADLGSATADEGIGMVNQFNSSDATKEKRDEYLKGMAAIAARGQKNAEGALGGFRTVRQGMNNAIEKMDPGATEGATSIEVLKRALDPVFIKFDTVLNSYVAWWVETTMLAKSMVTAIQSAETHPSDARMKSILARWTTIKVQYLNYTNTMHTLEDRHDELFKLIKASEAGSVEQKTTKEPDTPQTTTSLDRQQSSELEKDVEKRSGAPSDSLSWWRRYCCCCL